MRVGLVGLGNAGMTLHAPALAGIDATLVGCCDQDGGRRREAAARWNAPTFERLGDLLETAGPDVVIIGTPPETHAALCLESFAGGAHVICEKPIATSVVETDGILAAAQRYERRVAVNHEFRAMPIYRTLYDQLGQSDVGELLFAQAWQLMDLPPWKEPGWRSELLRWTLFEAGVHLVDYLLFLFQERPRAVTATVSSSGARDEASDAVALVTLEFSRGRLAQIVQNRLCVGETQYFEVRADASHSSLRASFGGRMRLSAGLLRSTKPHVRVEFGQSGIVWKERGHRRTLLGRNPADPAAAATRALLLQTLTAFRTGAPVPASGDDGRRVVEVLAACYLSAMEGRRVPLDGTEDEQVHALRMGGRRERS